MTAAHCLFNRATARFLQPDALHFLLGYKGGEYRSHARVARYAIGPDYNQNDANRSILADWAILTLTEPASRYLEIDLSPANASWLAGFPNDIRLR